MLLSVLHDNNLDVRYDTCGQFSVIPVDQLKKALLIFHTKQKNIGM
jgi:hypothetical protein